jgi:hypothetical protein
MQPTPSLSSKKQQSTTINNNNQTTTINTMLSSCPVGRPRRATASSPLFRPQETLGPSTMQPMQPVDIEWAPGDDTTAQRGTHAVTLLQMLDGGRGEGAILAYDPKTEEFKVYCRSLYTEGVGQYALNSTKVFRFMFYQARPQKTRGESRNRGQVSGAFNRAQ